MYLYPEEYRFLAGLLAVPVGLILMAYYYWWKATRQKPKSILLVDKVVRENIDAAIKNAVANSSLSRDQEIAIIEISAILFQLLEHNGPLFRYKMLSGYHYARTLSQIKEIVAETSLPKQIMGAAIELVYKSMHEKNEGKILVLKDFAKFTKELEQSP